jgi:hypothetical protein
MKSIDPPHALADHLRSLPREERIPLLVESLKAHTAAVSGIAQASIDPEAPFVALSPLLGDVFTRNKHLIKPWVKKSLGFPSFWQYEASLCNSISELARYLADELEPVMPETETFLDPYEGGGWGWPAPAAYRGEPLAHGRMAFVLGAGRSGTTLFRSMLSGHKQIYSPGELHLLPFDDMGQRQEALDRLQQNWMNAGLLDVLGEQFGLTHWQALAEIKTLADQKVPIVEIYQRIRGHLGNCWLIDKSPAYSLHPVWLQRAEQMFVDARYLFMTRHPYAVMDSFVKRRFHRYSASIWGFTADNPWQAAEKYWVLSNRHALDFIRDKPASRWLRVRFEDLIQNTGEVQEAVCHLLSLPFDEQMLNPYQPGRNLAPELRKRSQIESDLSEAWKKIRPPHKLSPFTLQVAEELGYEMP